MANRQYIGARYVPKIYGVWAADTSYEALTVVLYNNASYTSKKPVPHTVGNPADNPEYWACTAEYNAQVAQYAQQVSEYKNEVDGISDTVDGLSDSVASLSGLPSEVDALTDRVNALDNTDDIILCFSDSYGGTTGNPSGDTMTMFDYIKSILGRDSSNFKCEAYGGRGFCKDDPVYHPTEGTFIDSIGAFISNLTAEEKNKVSKVIVAAGRNDYEYTTDQIKAAITTFVTNTKAAIPKAKIYLMFIANGTNSGHGTKQQQKNVFLAYQQCTDCGAIYLAGGEAILRNSSMMAADGIHPSPSGKMALGRGVAEALLNGYCSVSYSNRSGSLSNVPSDTTIGFNILSYMSNNMVTLSMDGLGTIDFSSAKTAGSGTAITLGTFDGNRNMFFPAQRVCLPCNLSFYNGNNKVDAEGMLWITEEGSVVLRCWSATASVTFTRVVILSSGTVTHEAIDM